MAGRLKRGVNPPIRVFRFKADFDRGETSVMRGFALNADGRARSPWEWSRRRADTASPQMTAPARHSRFRRSIDPRTARARPGEEEMSAPAASPVPDHIPPELVHDFDFFAPPGGEDDLHLAWKRLHETAPDIFWTPRNGGHWVATRGEDIKEIQTNHQRFSQRIMWIPADSIDRRFLPANSDPPEHGPYRRIIMPAFLPAAIDALEPGIRDVCGALVAELAPRGRCEFIAEFARKLPIVVFLKMVDLPLDDREMLLDLATTIIHTHDPEKTGQAHAAMSAYMARWIDERRARPGEDLISTIVHAKVGDRPITPDEAFDLVALVLFGGLDTVITLMGFIWRYLAMHPEHRRELVERPDLRRNAMEELIRRHGVVNTARYITETCVYKGVPFRAGDMIQVPNSLLGLDERINPDPLTVDFQRRPVQHATFGNGPHTCPGGGLARREIGVALELWLDRIPDFAIAPGTKPQLIAGANNNVIARLDLVWPPG
jgi:cytochrome P450